MKKNIISCMAGLVALGMCWVGGVDLDKRGETQFVAWYVAVVAIIVAYKLQDD